MIWESYPSFLVEASKSYSEHILDRVKNGGLLLLRKRLSSLFLGWSWMTCGLPEFLGRPLSPRFGPSSKIKEQPGVAKIKGKLRRPTLTPYAAGHRPATTSHEKTVYAVITSWASGPEQVDPSLVLSEGCWFFLGFPCVYQRYLE